MAKRQSAFSKALQEAQNKEQEKSGVTVSQPDSETVTPLDRHTDVQYDGEAVKHSDSETVKPSNSTTVRQFEGEPVEHLNSSTAGQSHSETVIQPDRKEVKPLNNETVTQTYGETVKSGLEKTSFYIRHDQAEKLDDLAHAYKKQTGKRINRNDIVRTLIDQVDLERLLSSMEVH